MSDRAFQEAGGLGLLLEDALADVGDQERGSTEHMGAGALPPSLPAPQGSDIWDTRRVTRL